MSEDIWVGLDVHLDSITAAILEGDATDPEVVKLSGDLMGVRRLSRRLSKKGPVRACYEASGAGFVLHRVLTRDGFHCDIIAPSLIPRKPGDHRKTDRLDAVMLVKLYRSGPSHPRPRPHRRPGGAAPTASAALHLSISMQIHEASHLRDASQPWLGLSRWQIHLDETPPPVAQPTTP